MIFHKNKNVKLLTTIVWDERQNHIIPHNDKFFLSNSVLEAIICNYEYDFEVIKKLILKYLLPAT